MNLRPPPLREWSIENFKSVRNGHVDLRHLTVIVGANSSGKSSLLQSILAVAQTAQAGSSGPTLPLNGHLVSLGSFGDVVCASAARKEVRLRGVFALPHGWRQVWPEARRARAEPDSMTSTEWELRLKGGAPQDPGAANISRVEFKHRQRESGSGRWDIRISARARRTRPAVDGLSRDQLAASTHSGSMVVRGRSQTIEQVSLRAGLPASFLVPRPEVEVLIEQWLLALQDRRTTRINAPTVEPEEFLTQTAIDFAVTDVSERRASRPGAPVEEARVAFTELLRRRRNQLALLRAVSGNEEEIRNRVLAELGPGDDILVSPTTGVRSSVSAAVDALKGFLADGVTYLGPLRQDPEVSYSLTPGAVAGTIGTKGENVAGVLHTLSEQRVACPLRGGGTKEMPLLQATAYWLEMLEVAAAVETKALGRLGFGLKLRDSQLDRHFDLTSLGVGVSQLLPVIVACLLAAPGSLVILEQPELHLHPGLQQQLGDFLLDSARSGRQMIVETHSEHVVSRLRLRIAEDMSETTQSLIQLIYAERFGGVTEYRAVEPNRYGGIEDWPKGFFDQSARESQEILRAALEKRDQSPE